MPIRLPDWATWKAYRERMGYPELVCDDCGMDGPEWRVDRYHVNGRIALLCEDCLGRYGVGGDVRAALEGR